MELELEPDVEAVSLAEPVEPVEGPAAVAPAMTPCVAGTRYVGRGDRRGDLREAGRAAPRLIALSDSRRPLTVTRLFRAMTNRWTPAEEAREMEEVAAEGEA